MLKKLLHHGLGIFSDNFFNWRISNSRKESNSWLKTQCADIRGEVLSIGSGDDSDGEGSFYRLYFSNCSSYTTSEISSEFKPDIIIDVKEMTSISDQSFDCVLCSGVLEHVDDYSAGLSEITRILKFGGILLLGLPFRQALHMPPNDFWRFTEFGIRHMLKDHYEIINIESIDNSPASFPAAYWVKARKVAH